MLIQGPSTQFARRQVRLETLIGLRWLAVVGQTVAILVVQFGLGFDLPVIPCFLLIALSAALNLYLRHMGHLPQRLAAHWAGLLLAYDVLQLAGLVYLTGGLENPFSVLLLVPALVSATTLPPVTTILLCILVLSLATLLGVYHLPLPWRPGVPIEFPFVYIAGMWVALTSSLVFMAIYAWRVAEEARQLADALAATELLLAREQHLSALDGLAAATAHELGTPLATIAVVAKELGRSVPEDSPYAEDISLVGTQVDRCRSILGRLASLKDDDDGFDYTSMKLSDIIHDIVEPHRAFGITIDIEATGLSDEPRSERNPAVRYGLGNLVENAVDFAESRVDIELYWDQSVVNIKICDDGPGFAPDIIDKVGEPYVTSRGRRRLGTANPGDDLESWGLGLGFFIAKTLIERSGAKLTFGNRKGVSGAEINIVWPRSAFDPATSLKQSTL